MGHEKWVLRTFKGGVHPYEGKELAKDEPIVEVLPKGDLVYPLSQHIGAPATPIVAVGDHGVERTEDRRGRWLCVISDLRIGIRYGKGDRAAAV